MFSSQYLHPTENHHHHHHHHQQQQQQQQSPSFDAKNSPLALLAQTCNSIGKDVVPFNRTLSSTSTSNVFSSSISKCGDFQKEDSHSRQHQRCSSEDDVTSTMTSNKTREVVRKSGQQFAEDGHVDVVGLSVERGSVKEEVGVEGPSEPLPLTSKHQSKSTTSKSKATHSSNGSSVRRSNAGHKNSETSSRKSEGRSSKDHRSESHPHKTPESWPMNLHLPFKPNAFQPGLDNIYPGYFNFFHPDYTAFLKNYYMSQASAHSPTSPSLDYFYPTFSEQFTKLRSSPQTPHCFPPTQPPTHSISPPANKNLKYHGDLFADRSGKHQSTVNSPDMSLAASYFSPSLLSNPTLPSTKDLQSLSYFHFLCQHNPLLFHPPAILQCPFSYKPINESCSKLFNNFDDVIEHVRLHWTDAKDPPAFVDNPAFPAFVPLACPPYGWPLKAFGNSFQYSGKLPASPSRFHPYSKSFISSHVP